MLPRFRPLVVLLLVLASAWLLTGLYHRYKPLPAEVGKAWPARPAQGVELLVDDTWVEDGERRFEQAIFDEFFRLIAQAKKLVVVDMFLYNEMAGATDNAHRALSGELTRALVERKRQVPDMPVMLITDPFNTLYGGVDAPHLETLREAGISVVETDLSRLRDSNPSWSGLWRLCCQWLGNSRDGGWLPNPTGEGKVTLRTYLQLINFKANHRKTLVVDEGDTWAGLVTSANTHDASSAHSNMGLRFRGPAALDLLHSERAVMRFSGADDAERLAGQWPAPEAPPPAEDDDRLRVLTEGAVRDALLDTVGNARAGESLDVGVFYLSHRPLVRALAAAQERGVRLRLLLDPNKDAFGRQKSGIPNRQVAQELHRKGVPIRWCATHGEQCHTKMLLRYTQGSSDSVPPARLIIGSSNFTRRNLDNMNLETSVELIAGGDHPAVRAARDAFEARWSNRDGREYSQPYDEFADDSRLKYGLYRVMEFTGWSTF